MPTQACGASATTARSVCPSKARTKYSRPVARQASIMRTGNWPPPARMPSLALTCAPGLDDRPRRIDLDELDEIHHRPAVGIEPGDVGQPLGHRTFLGEEQAIGGAQRLNVVSRETAPLETDDI